MCLLQYEPEDKFPLERMHDLVWDSLRQGRLSRVAVMSNEQVFFDSVRDLGADWLEADRNYHWSGWEVQRAHHKPDKRIVIGTYEEWFRWYMRFQRFRAFHTLVLVDPIVALSDERIGGYLDGMLARLAPKVRQVIVVSKPLPESIPPSDQRRTAQVLRALLYGTRLSRPNLVAQSQLTFIPIQPEMVGKAMSSMDPWVVRPNSWCELEPSEERRLESLDPERPMERKPRFRREEAIPDNMLSDRALEDVARDGWVTVPIEVEKLAEWLRSLNERGDSRLRSIQESNEGMSHEQWQSLLYPTRNQVRSVLDGLMLGGKLERRKWFREIGRPAFAYALPGKTPFLEQRCGQCAFYSPAKRRCNLWWLANNRQRYIGAMSSWPALVSSFELHKMKHAFHVGPHSTACLRFLKKKRDHLRDAIPKRCEICRRALPQAAASLFVTCRNCSTSYLRFQKKVDRKVRVQTAYAHEFNRIYHQVTGGEAKSDLAALKGIAKEKAQDQRSMHGLDEVDDILAEERIELEPEPERAHSHFDQALQESVDNLAQSTDIAKQLSIAMARSSINATRSVAALTKVPLGLSGPLIAKQERYLTLIAKADQSHLLSYEALVMKQYWECFRLALKPALQWLGPRKRSRFVTDFVRNPAGRAKGYSPLDAAINYLHQRRLKQAERVNIEVGFPGSSDGFLHKKQHNSRKIGLVLDMIDPFKFADREELLLVAIDQGLTWKDFQIETDRRGSNFYHPRQSVVSKLEEAGTSADDLVVDYLGRGMKLKEAYRLFAEGLLEALMSRDPGVFRPFIFGAQRSVA